MRVKFDVYMKKDILNKSHYNVFICLIFLLIAGMLYDNILIFDDIHVNLAADENSEYYENINDSDNDSDNDSVNGDDNENCYNNDNGDEDSIVIDVLGIEHYIYINLDIHTIFVYKNGELLRTYPCSGGKTQTPSPTGTWKIISKSRWGGSFGGAWMGLNVPWGKYGIHGTKYPWFIGKSNESKGCIRMMNKDANELYRLMPYGAIVTIVHNTAVFRTLKNGDIGSDVKMVQQSLKALGYYNGYPDGKYGKLLETSVKKFQKDNLIKQTGMVGIVTHNAIKKKMESISNMQYIP